MKTKKQSQNFANAINANATGLNAILRSVIELQTSLDVEIKDYAKEFCKKFNLNVQTLSQSKREETRQRICNAIGLFNAQNLPVELRQYGKTGCYYSKVITWAKAISMINLDINNKDYKRQTISQSDYLSENGQNASNELKEAAKKYLAEQEKQKALNKLAKARQLVEQAEKDEKQEKEAKKRLEEIAKSNNAIKAKLRLKEAAKASEPKSDK